ncbi:MAG: DUF3574 domain-containing protein [Firmicutes bacterium HGW-Firmicutes-15]|nr:MAG: DUF3574 domain-containing protein [Firmicutes bacterium HGW-Firmicutes-15]
MKKPHISIVLIIVLCFMLSGCVTQTGLGQNEVLKYTMYIGLNDEDTYTQQISYEEAEKKVSDIALKYVDGFTARVAKGAYKDEKGVITHENSLVFEFYNATDQQMKAIMDEILRDLNQNSILIEKQKVNYEFYEGAKP